MDRGKRQGDRLRKVGAIWCATNNAYELAANYKHQHNTTHQYIYYYQQTATRIPSNNESTAANQNTQSVGKTKTPAGSVIPPQERAEKLSLEKFVQLTEGLGKVP
jgi:hypothetical protein